jgi:geranylgeranyl diphosphate synthase, type III
VLTERPKTPTLKLEAIDYLRHRTRSFEYSIEVLDRIEDEMRQEIARHGGNEHLEAILDALVQKGPKRGAI